MINRQGKGIEKEDGNSQSKEKVVRQSLFHHDNISNKESVSSHHTGFNAMYNDNNSDHDYDNERGGQTRGNTQTASETKMEECNHSLKVLLMLFYFDTICIVNLFISSGIFLVESLYDLLNILCLVVFIVSQFIIVLRVIHYRVGEYRDRVTFAVILIAIFTQQIMNDISLSIFEEDSIRRVIVGRIYYNRLGFLFYAVCTFFVYNEILLSITTQDKLQTIGRVVVMVFTCFTQKYRIEEWYYQLLAGLLCFIGTLLFGLVRTSIRKTKADGPIRLMNKNNEEEGLKGIVREPLDVIDVVMDSSVRGVVFDRLIVQKSLELVEKPPSFISKPNDKIKDISILNLSKKDNNLSDNEHQMDIKNSPTLHCDLMMRIGISTGKVIETCQNVREYKTKHIFEKLAKKIVLSKPIELVPSSILNKKTPPTSLIPQEKLVSAKGKFIFHSFDKLKNKLILKSDHTDFQTLINDVRNEFMRTDQTPFREVLDLNTILLDKSFSSKLIPKRSFIKESFSQEPGSEVRRSITDLNAPLTKKVSELVNDERHPPLEIISKMNIFMESPNDKETEKDPKEPNISYLAEIRITIDYNPEDRPGEKGDSIRYSPDMSIVKVPQLLICIRKINQQLASQSQNERFLNLVSHEMRSPLVGILGMIQLFITKSQGPISKNNPQELKNLISYYLMNSLSHIQNLLDACQLILDLAKNKGAETNIKAIEFNLKNLVRDACRLFSELNKKKDSVEIKFEYDPNQDEFIKSDPVRIRQIIMNLLSNAIKYTTNGSVTVKVIKISFSKIKISIKDTGIGIRESDLGKLFKEFGRIKNNEDEKLNSNGVGLGLQFSNLLAFSVCPKDNREGIKVESQFGSGSEFYFVVKNYFVNQVEADIFKMKVIPMIVQQALLKEISTLEVCDEDRAQLRFNTLRKLSNVERSKYKSVLVVDDSELILEMLEAQFELAGLEVETCSNPVEALDMIKEKLKSVCIGCSVYDVILTDREMPHMTGLELSIEIRKIERYQKIPIICASANEIEEKELVYFTETMLKPISSSDIQYLISKYIKAGSVHTCEAFMNNLTDPNFNISLTKGFTLNKKSKTDKLMDMDKGTLGSENNIRLEIPNTRDQQSRKYRISGVELGGEEIKVRGDKYEKEEDAENMWFVDEPDNLHLENIYKMNFTVRKNANQ